MPFPAVEAALQQRWGIEPKQAKLLARLSGGCPGWAVTAASGEQILQERAEKLEALYEVIRADTESRFSHAAQLASRYAQNRAEVKEKLDLWLGWWRDLLLVKAGCPDCVANIDQMDKLNSVAGQYTMQQIRDCLGSIGAAERQLRQNANPRLVLEVLMLDMPEKTEGNRMGSKTGVIVNDG
jgi:DNA polymerase-3 subunit delta'